MKFKTFFQGGMAVADLLFGIRSPSGKLPVTLPRNDGMLQFTPAQYPGLQENSGVDNEGVSYRGVDGVATRGLQTYYSENLEIGYRWFEANNVRPLFAYGHGLSYGEFVLKDIHCQIETRTGIKERGGEVLETGENHLVLLEKEEEGHGNSSKTEMETSRTKTLIQKRHMMKDDKDSKITSKNKSDSASSSMTNQKHEITSTLGKHDRDTSDSKNRNKERKDVSKSEQEQEKHSVSYDPSGTLNMYSKKQGQSPKKHEESKSQKKMLTVSFCLENKNAIFGGSQVVFLFLKHADRPFRELAGFVRVDDIQPEETRCIKNKPFPAERDILSFVLDDPHLLEHEKMHEGALPVSQDIEISDSSSSHLKQMKGVEKTDHLSVDYPPLIWSAEMQNFIPGKGVRWFIGFSLDDMQEITDIHGM